MDENGIVTPDIETLPCKTCAFARLLGNRFYASSCAKYKDKPHGVYFKSEECPEYQKKED